MYRLQPYLYRHDFEKTLHLRETHRRSYRRMSGVSLNNLYTARSKRVEEFPALCRFSRHSPRGSLSSFVRSSSASRPHSRGMVTVGGAGTWRPMTWRSI